MSALGLFAGGASAFTGPQGPPAQPVSAPFLQCPSVGGDSSCGWLIDITNGGAMVHQDQSQQPYDTNIGQEDILVGVQNDSSSQVSSMQVGVPGTFNDTFGFDGDGLCSGLWNVDNCDVITTGTAGQTNTNDPNDYYGPGASFANINANQDSGTVVFNPPLQPGQYTFFTLEGGFDAVVTAGCPGAAPRAVPAAGPQCQLNDQVSTNQNHNPSAQSGASIQIPSGSTGETDQATITSANGGGGGTVNYKLFSDSACQTPVANAAFPQAGDTEAVTNGTAAPSVGVGGLPDGFYYWLATYSGDNTVPLSAASSVCGGEVLTIGNPPPKPQRKVRTVITASTSASGTNVSAPSGSSAIDNAFVTDAAGNTVGTAGGQVTYTAYTDATCQTTAAPMGSAKVTNGVGGASKSVTLPIGTYYLQAVYSGDANNAPAVSPCGAEVLTITTPGGGGSTTPQKQFPPPSPVTAACPANTIALGCVPVPGFLWNGCQVFFIPSAPAYGRAGELVIDESCQNPAYMGSATMVSYFLVGGSNCPTLACVNAQRSVHLASAAATKKKKKKKKKKIIIVRAAPVTFTAVPGKTQMIVLKVPASVINALKKHQKVSALIFETLTTPRGIKSSPATIRVPSVPAPKPKKKKRHKKH